MGAKIALAAAVALAGGAWALSEDNKCHLDADGQVVLNGNTLPAHMSLGEGEVGDTVAITDIGSTTPAVLCELES